MGGPTNPSEKPFFLGRVRGAFGSVPIPLEGQSPQPERATALGLGGFPHFAAHPFIWFQALGFRMEQVPSSKLMGVPPPGDLPVPVAIGLEREGDVLLKPFCPPYYKDMEEAVLAFVAYQFARGRGRSAMVASRPAGKMPRRCR